MIFFDANGDISEHLIISKLKNKSNWLSEIYTLRKAIPQLWKFIFKYDESIKTRVKTDFFPLLKNNRTKIFITYLETMKRKNHTFITYGKFYFNMTFRGIKYT
jgi:hypothetical protein